jgi:acetate kinase
MNNMVLYCLFQFKRIHFGSFMKCLIPNIGSTSFKYRVLDMPEETVLAEGRIERIGQPGGECADYESAIRKCIEAISGEGKALRNLSEVGAVGFKVVHAGSHSAPQRIDDEFLAAMEEFKFLVPAHNPPYIAAIKAFRKELPGVPLVAVIETGPYRKMDEAATTYSVPYEWREKYGIRRYGFHGASHRSTSEHVQKLLSRKNLRHISCHLGGSSSVAAFRDGVAVDVSMGTSPQSGLPQNNRVGDVDVFGVLLMMKKLGLDPDQMAEILGSKSGLAGISGGTGDIRDLDQAAKAGDKRSQLALDVFVRAIRHYIGAFMVTLGGLDVITFSGGIGENSASIRAAVLKNLTAFGVEVSEARNASLKGEGIITTDNSAVRVFVVPANEEIIVARETAAVVGRTSATEQTQAVQAR